jgi:two-component system, cell cycle response regulator
MRDKAMKKVSTIQIIDSLAEITRHNDREIIEKSLLKTLDELAVQQEFRLYKVIEKEPEIALGLLAFSVNGTIETGGFHTKKYIVPEYLNDSIATVIYQGCIEQIKNNEDDVTHYIYPAFDRKNDVFAILIQDCKETIDYDMPRFVHGLLKVYSNYLELIEQNQRDKLTQLLNRETLDKEITRILIRNNERPRRQSLKRERDPLGFWLGVIDIDHFKSVNDRFGHLFGDEVLILMAQQMKKDIRGDEDLIYRYGGEEFVILLQAYGLNEARGAFDRLRRNVEARELPQIGHVTISIGVVEVTNQESPINVIGCADQALYYAKEHGRNQVCTYETLMEQGLIEKIVDGSKEGDLEFF